MAVFALADLHLSFLAPFDPENSSEAEIYKPMDKFGANWREHYRQIYDHWQKQVGKEDTVLLPGDISWAMNLAEAAFDFAFLAQLPGRKILSRGNHDYWWQGPHKIRSALPENMAIIQNDCVCLPDWAICGSRGWLNPQNKEFQKEDEKIYLRELQRLELSLKEGQKSGLPIICLLHYPPFGDNGEASGFLELMEAYGVKKCAYGHFHGPGVLTVPQDTDIQLYLVSADQADFCPQPLTVEKTR